LGRWIGGEGKDKYGQAPWFGELVERHKAFHNLTEEAVRLQERGESEEAAKRMNEAYGLFARITQVATYKIPANFLKLWAKMNPHTLSTKPWRVVA